MKKQQQQQQQQNNVDEIYLESKSNINLDVRINLT